MPDTVAPPTVSERIAAPLPPVTNVALAPVTNAPDYDPCLVNADLLRGPAFYVVMFVLCGYLMWQAGWSGIDLNLGKQSLTGWSALPVVLGAIALVVSYYYLVRKQRVIVDELFTMSERGASWYRRSYNPAAIVSTVIGALAAMLPVLTAGNITGMYTAAQHSWFIGCGLGLVCYYLLATRGPLRLPAPVFETR